MCFLKKLYFPCVPIFIGTEGVFDGGSFLLDYISALRYPVVESIFIDRGEIPRLLKQKGKVLTLQINGKHFVIILCYFLLNFKGYNKI